MSRLIEIRIPQYPECWDTCGSCAAGAVVIQEVLVKPGDVIRRDDNVIVLETGKIALDIPTPYAGRVAEVMVSAGDEVAAGAVILTIAID